MKNSLAGNIKISKNFRAEFLRLVDETEKKRNFELLSRENTLKRKSKKTKKQDGVSKLKKAFQVRQERRKKIA